MAKKKKPPEHENLERWMVSYADFVTLLFATFVVLYALSQVDIKDFKSLEESIQQAFSAPSIMQGSEGVMQNSSNSIMDTSQGTSMIAPLMLEYMSQRYEDDSMEEIEQKINQEVKTGEVNGVKVIQTDRGLLIRFSDDYLFDSNSATLSKQAKKKLDKVGAAISEKFIMHNMRVEGHTDSQPVASKIFPSNWELSSARSGAVIRYLIERFGFMPSLFTSIGFADTRPLADNSTPKGKATNRRVEILILKNQFKKAEYAKDDVIKMSKEDQEKMQAHRLETINKINTISDAAKKLTNGDIEAAKSAVVLNSVYNKESQRLSKEMNAFDPEVRKKLSGQGGWLKPPASKVESIKVFEKKQK